MPPAQLGRAPPPPLPGGYALGERVVYVAEDYTFASGNKLTRGAAGEVMGPTAVEHVAGKGLSVLFPGNKSTVACELADLRRAEDARDHSSPANASETKDEARSPAETPPPRGRGLERDDDGKPSPRARGSSSRRFRKKAAQLTGQRGFFSQKHRSPSQEPEAAP